MRIIILNNCRHIQNCGYNESRKQNEKAGVRKMGLTLMEYERNVMKAAMDEAIELAEQWANALEPTEKNISTREGLLQIASVLKRGKK